jgi:uncharacterized protein YyaL (SSP411 family)
MSQLNSTYTNALISESSPYLLQHAHNPVNWLAWNESSLQKAIDEDKLLLISIGYSACHWCHVMEHECFEDEETAGIMNRHYICIKVDREERPDVDQVYMQAVQLMTGRGGWPLNCIALPGGEPIYGGTYFPKVQWQEVLLQIAEFYKKDKAKCREYAKEIMEAISQPSLTGKSQQHKIDKDLAVKAYENWRPQFDLKEGGPDRVPKFPLPNNFEFLLRYYFYTGNNECLRYCMLTLNKMAFGGIYDQLGGGFARYSTDADWKVPHFEKMLYDNAQLVSLYSQAWQVSSKPLYRQVVYETLNFIERELTHESGGFYSALDADSEGEEGKFYVWKKEEIDRLLGERAAVFSDYYNISEKGYWEKGNYILLRSEEDESFARKHGMSDIALNEFMDDCKAILLSERQKRIRPGLDDKIIVSWNAMMLKGYVDAFKAFGDARFLLCARKNAEFIERECTAADGNLYHTFKNGKARINGYLEDYSFTMEAFIALYEAAGNEKYLLRAKQMAAHCLDHFYDKDSGFFYFTSDQDPPLITRKTETEDNVIPASCSSLSKALFRLDLYFPGSGYSDIALRMLSHLTGNISRYCPAYSNWAMLLLDTVYPFYQVAITGNDTAKLSAEINKLYLPNKILAASDEGHIPLLKDKDKKDENLIYICENHACLLPVKNVEDMMNIVKPIIEHA